MGLGGGSSAQPPTGCPPTAVANSGRCLAGADGLLEHAPCGELRHRCGRNVHLLTRVARIDAHSRLAIGRCELAEPGEIAGIALHERVCDRVVTSLDSLL